MNDDLISRKAVINYLREQNNNLLMEKQKNGIVSTEACRGMESALIAFRSFILNLPTAFDKEKVISEMKKEYEDAIRLHNENIAPAHSFSALMRKDAWGEAVEIVEKGGIE